jgi:hypothetical protein
MTDAHLEPTGTHALWDETFQKLGRSAPAQRADESMPNYQRRLAELGSRYVPRGEQIAGVDFSQLPNEVVPRFAEMMRERVEANLRRTDNLDPNDASYRTVLVTDENTGGKTREFYRSRPFTDDFKPPIRRVVRINAPEQRTLYSSNRREAASTWF